MWKRKDTKPSDSDNFYKWMKKDDEEIKLGLVDERNLAEAWAACVGHENISEKGISDLEEMIKTSVNLCWGQCRFEIDRAKKTIIVKAADGRSMNIVTGDLIYEINNYDQTSGVSCGVPLNDNHLACTFP